MHGVHYQTKWNGWRKYQERRYDKHGFTSYDNFEYVSGSGGILNWWGFMLGGTLRCGSISSWYRLVCSCSKQFRKCSKQFVIWNMLINFAGLYIGALGYKDSLHVSLSANSTVLDKSQTRMLAHLIDQEFEALKAEIL